MTLLHTLLLSIVEGITEFLPISSTGHLILTSALLHIRQTDFVKSFEIIIQLGAILAVVILYGKELLTKKVLWWKILAAFIPTAIIGKLLFKFIVSTLLGNSIVVVWSLIIGGVLLIIFEKMWSEKEHHVARAEDISYKNAVIIGLFQALAVIPGVSRSAATIIGGMLTGMKRNAAVEFSFLLAIPTMLAATVLDLYDQMKSNVHYTTNEYMMLAIGFVVSCIVAIGAVKFLVGFVQKHTFIPFGIYRIVVAILFLLIVR